MNRSQPSTCWPWWQSSGTSPFTGLKKIAPFGHPISKWIFSVDHRQFVFDEHVTHFTGFGRQPFDVAVVFHRHSVPNIESIHYYIIGIPLTILSTDRLNYPVAEKLVHRSSKFSAVAMSPGTSSGGTNGMANIRKISSPWVTPVRSMVKLRPAQSWYWYHRYYRIPRPNRKRRAWSRSIGLDGRTNKRKPALCYAACAVSPCR